MLNTIKVKLNKIDFTKNPEFKFEYDFGTTTTFKIKYLGSEESENQIKLKVPFIKEGQGYGMIDDLANFELIEKVKEAKESDEYKYFVPNLFNDLIVFDPEEFDLQGNNFKMEVLFKKIKDAYEKPQEY